MADWWDAVELWLTQLPFGFQVVLATVVLVPLCWGTAVLSDRVVDDRRPPGHPARLSRRARVAESSILNPCVVPRA
jgi:hypothetical protein